MIKPTIGHKVWFYPNGATLAGAIANYGGQPLDATVVYVHNDSMINLRVTDHAGNAFPLCSVLLLQDDSVAPLGRAYAAWMPYQKGQAAKAEAVEKANEDHGGD